MSTPMHSYLFAHRWPKEKQINKHQHLTGKLKLCLLQSVASTGPDTVDEDPAKNSFFSPGATGRCFSSLLQSCRFSFPGIFTYHRRLAECFRTFPSSHTRSRILFSSLLLFAVFAFSVSAVTRSAPRAFPILEGSQCNYDFLFG